MCLFLTVDASKVQPKQRTSMVALAVRRAAPFNDPDFGIAWLGDFAAIWYWSRSRITTDQELVAGTATSFLPEAILIGEALPGDGVQLFALECGFEGRVWKNSRLIASRWWQEAPSPTEWQGFVRGAGLPSREAPPLPRTLAAAQQPWSEQAAAWAGLTPSSLEKIAPKLLAGTALVAAALISFELSTLSRSLYVARQARVAAASLDEPLKKILSAREKTDLDLAQIGALLKLRAPHSQVTLLAEMSRIMPGGDWRMLQWQQPAVGRIEATISTANADLESIVTAWEASPLFEAVSTASSSRPDEITIKAKVSQPEPVAQ